MALNAFSTFLLVFCSLLFGRCSTAKDDSKAEYFGLLVGGNLTLPTCQNSTKQSWFLNGTNLSSAPRNHPNINITETTPVRGRSFKNSTLTIVNATLKESGEYKCVTSKQTYKYQVVIIDIPVLMWATMRDKKNTTTAEFKCKILDLNLTSALLKPSAKYNETYSCSTSNRNSNNITLKWLIPNHKILSLPNSEHQLKCDYTNMTGRQIKYGTFLAKFTTAQNLVINKFEFTNTNNFGGPFTCSLMPYNPQNNNPSNGKKASTNAPPKKVRGGKSGATNVFLNLNVVFILVTTIVFSHTL